ncbi:hypothetical protein HPB50_019658 [Hyalomma asiaticum]|uniref:Uncharacterized protein n=1 Tax=Hyalomma asiaticum TaxID=266040 RepID=A0ACB7T9K7_HYAAI|nr:hypothetical protein HPB50_019658 [Hyalomma asiaticum]
MDKAAERRARRAAAARARRSDPAVRAREAEASRDSARRRREDPAVRALTLLTSFIERRGNQRIPPEWRRHVIIKLLPRNMHPQFHEHRRRARAEAHD